VKFTDLSLKALLHPPIGQRDYADDAVSGLCVRVGIRTKTFMVLVSHGDRRDRVKLGSYPDLTLSKAREKARDLLAHARVTKTETPAVRFEEALDTFYRVHLPRMRPGSQAQARRLLERHFRKAFTGRRLEEIRTPELATHLDRIGAPAEQRNAFVWLRTFFNWSYRRGYLDQNPIARLTGLGRSNSRERVLSDAEIVAVWNNVPEGDYGALVRLLILTGQRKGQWLAFRPSYIQGDTVTWPPDFMKGGRVHTIPCTDLMRRIIGNRACFGKWTTSYNKRALDKASGTTGWTLHDLRRTFATKLAELGIAPHVIERILAHSGGTISGVAAIYNRHHFLPEMRLAMQKWETRLQALLSTMESANGTADLRDVHRQRA
jgi:integrase